MNTEILRLETPAIPNTRGSASELREKNFAQLTENWKETLFYDIVIVF